jgi:aryl-alcohol dehydrogenase-like predicted oxidoreductase
MQQRKLGPGPLVSALGLGCLSFGGIFGPTDEAESLACLDAAWDAGITFIDTANIYGMGRSETDPGQMAGQRKRPAMHCHQGRLRPTTPPPHRQLPEHLRAELEGSLKRLGRDHVELLLHPPPRTRPPAGRGGRHPGHAP